MKVHLILEIGNSDQPVKSVHLSMTNAMHRLDQIESNLKETISKIRTAPPKLIRTSETSLIIFDEIGRKTRTYLIDTREAQGHPLEMLADEA